jgi:hypothetical protein
MSLFLSGTVYTDRGVMPDLSGLSISLCIDGGPALLTTTSSTFDGSFSFSSGVTITGSERLTVYLQGNTQVGALIAIANTANTVFDIYEDNVVLQTNFGALTLADIHTALANGDSGLTAMVASSSTTSLTLQAGKSIFIGGPGTFAVSFGTSVVTSGSDVIVGSSCTLDGGSSLVRCLGDFDSHAGTLSGYLTMTLEMGGGSGPRNLNMVNSGTANLPKLRIVNSTSVVVASATNSTINGDLFIETGSSLDLSAGGNGTFLGRVWENRGTYTDAAFMTFVGRDVYILGHTTFGNFTKHMVASSNDTLWFEAGSTTTFAAGLDIQGNAPSPLSAMLNVRSTLDGVAYNWDTSSINTGNQILYAVNISDCDLAASFHVIDANTCNDAGGNSNFNFGPALEDQGTSATLSGGTWSASVNAVYSTLIVVGVQGTASSITLGGVSLTKLTSATDGNAYIELWYANLSSNTGAGVTLTVNATNPDGWTLFSYATIRSVGGVGLTNLTTDTTNSLVLDLLTGMKGAVGLRTGIGFVSVDDANNGTLTYGGAGIDFGPASGGSGLMDGAFNESAFSFTDPNAVSWALAGAAIDSSSAIPRNDWYLRRSDEPIPERQRVPDERRILDAWLVPATTPNRTWMPVPRAVHGIPQAPPATSLRPPLSPVLLATTDRASVWMQRPVYVGPLPERPSIPEQVLVPHAPLLPGTTVTMASYVPPARAQVLQEPVPVVITTQTRLPIIAVPPQAWLPSLRLPDVVTPAAAPPTEVRILTGWMITPAPDWQTRPTVVTQTWPDTAQPDLSHLHRRPNGWFYAIFGVNWGTPAGMMFGGI